MTIDAQSKLAARYGIFDASALPWNATVHQFLDQRSVRAFAARALPVGAVETLVATAQSASGEGSVKEAAAQRVDATTIAVPNIFAAIPLGENSD